MLSVGKIIGERYQIESRLSEGGMGTIYLAYDSQQKCQVVIKAIRYENSVLKKALEEEAKILKRLNHPSLPKFLDTIIENENQQGEIFLLVMQFIEGNDLADWIEKTSSARQLQMSEILHVLNWANQLLEVIHFLHQQKAESGEPTPIIHRDIKPSNLKIDKQNRLLLLDFGLAKEGEKTLFYGHSYTAPVEQITKSGTDRRSDVYAAGASIYNLLTGVAPPASISRLEAKSLEAPDPLKPAHEINDLIPEKISEVLKKALALNKENRYQSALEMKDALRLYTPTEIIDEPQLEYLLPPTKVVAALEGPKVIWKLKTDPRSTAGYYQVRDEDDYILADQIKEEFEENLDKKTDTLTRYFYAVGGDGTVSTVSTQAILTISAFDEAELLPPSKVVGSKSFNQIVWKIESEPTSDLSHYLVRDNDGNLLADNINSKYKEKILPNQKEYQRVFFTVDKEGRVSESGLPSTFHYKPNRVLMPLVIILAIFMVSIGSYLLITAFRDKPLDRAETNVEVQKTPDSSASVDQKTPNPDPLEAGLNTNTSTNTNVNSNSLPKPKTPTNKPDNVNIPSNSKTPTPTPTMTPTITPTPTPTITPTHRSLADILRNNRNSVHKLTVNFNPDGKVTYTIAVDDTISVESKAGKNSPMVFNVICGKPFTVTITWPTASGNSSTRHSYKPLDCTNGPNWSVKL